MVLVDVQNMYYSAKNIYGKKLNFGALLKRLVAGRELVRAVAYVIRAEIGEKEQAFYDALQEEGFDIREKELQTFAGGAKKGDWDVGIAMDAIRYAPKVDSIVLVSGDGDFEPLVGYLKSTFGTIVEVAAFGKTCSSKLKTTADEVFDIDQHTRTMLIRYFDKASPASNRPQEKAVSESPTSKLIPGRFAK